MRQPFLAVESLGDLESNYTHTHTYLYIYIYNVSVFGKFSKSLLASFSLDDTKYMAITLNI